MGTPGGVRNVSAIWIWGLAGLLTLIGLVRYASVPMCECGFNSIRIQVAALSELIGLLLVLFIMSNVIDTIVLRRAPPIILCLGWYGACAEVLVALGFAVAIVLYQTHEGLFAPYVRSLLALGALGLGVMLALLRVVKWHLLRRRVVVGAWLADAGRACTVLVVSAVWSIVGLQPLVQLTHGSFDSG